MNKKEVQKILRKKGVISVGIGYKMVGGVKTDRKCVVVGVEKKLNYREILKRDLVPSKMSDGMITDVIQTKKIVIYENTEKKRPCPPGYSIGHPSITAGTLGCYVVDREDDSMVILSNNHVIAASNEAENGDVIIQPGSHDGGMSPSDDFGFLKRFVPVKMTLGMPDCPIAMGAAKIFNVLAVILGRSHRLVAIKQEDDTENLVDAAIADVISALDIELEIPDIGVPSGTIWLELGMEVFKQGRTTGFTRGIVDQVDMTVNVQYGEGKLAMFTDQVGIGGEFSAGGDSGSGIFCQTISGTRLGGLLFAGGEGITIANRIGNVFSLLNLKL